MQQLFVFAALVVACVAVAPPSIVRPCKLTDYRCIGHNLRANSVCNPYVYGSVPSEYRMTNVRFDAPFFNASYVDKTLVVRNHNKCFVSEFFFNVQRDTAVLSVDCPHLDLESNRTLIQHNSKREDTEYQYHIRADYPLIRLTTNLRHANRLDLCSAFVFGEVTELPNFFVNPLDNATNNFLSRDLSVMNIYERETFFYRAPMLMRYFVNNYICNFRC
ncbi:hypothetical protein ACJJTC_011100 [Scirpophaga incertulas]